MEFQRRKSAANAAQLGHEVIQLPYKAPSNPQKWKNRVGGSPGWYKLALCITVPSPSFGWWAKTALTNKLCNLAKPLGIGKVELDLISKAIPWARTAVQKSRKSARARALMPTVWCLRFPVALR